MDDNCCEIEKRLQNDPEAFGELYELNYKSIFNYILYSTGNVEATLDLTSETFLRALRGLPLFDYRKGSFTAWLYGIASRVIASYYRKLNITMKHTLSKREYLSVREEIWEHLSLEDIEDTKKELERSDDFLMLSSLFKKLPAKYREVLFLRFFEDKSLEDIADTLRRPVGTVKAQCHRGLNLLRKWMQPFIEMERMEEKKEIPTEKDASLEEAEEIGP